MNTVAIVKILLAILAIVVLAPVPPLVSAMEFPEGTATTSESCGACHMAIYREFAFGFGSDIRYKPTSIPAKPGEKLALPANVSATATAHAFAGVEPFPIHSREAEEEGKSCNVCHFPEPFAIPEINIAEMAKPKGRPKGKEAGGLTCASCHLTPEGKIRGPYDVKGPHDTVADPAIQTSAMCAYCHSMGKRVAGKGCCTTPLDRRPFPTATSQCAKHGNYSTGCGEKQPDIPYHQRRCRAFGADRLQPAGYLPACGRNG